MSYRDMRLSLVNRRVLVIAPDLGADMETYFREELRILQNSGAQIHVLPGDLSIPDLYDYKQPADIIWVISHGNAGGIQLANGDLITAEDLAALVRNTGAKMVVLNVCESIYLAASMQWRLMDDDREVLIIGSKSKVLDASAFRFGASLIQNIMRGMTVEEAFKRSAHSDKYVPLFVPGRGIEHENEVMQISLAQSAINQSNEQQDLIALFGKVRNLERKTEEQRQGLMGLTIAVERIERNQRRVLYRTNPARLIPLLFAILFAFNLFFIGLWFALGRIEQVITGSFTGWLQMTLLLIVLIFLLALAWIVDRTVNGRH